MNHGDVVKLIRVYADGYRESLSGKEFEKFSSDDVAVATSAYIHGVKYRKAKWKQERMK